MIMSNEKEFLHEISKIYKRLEQAKKISSQAYMILISKELNPMLIELGRLVYQKSLKK